MIHSLGTKGQCEKISKQMEELLKTEISSSDSSSETSVNSIDSSDIVLNDSYFEISNKKSHFNKAKSSNG